MEHEGDFWEERLIRPVDIYPEHKVEGATWIEPLSPGKYRNVAHFVEIGTDAGITGIGGPMPLEQAFIVETIAQAPASLAMTRWRPNASGIACIAALVHGRKGVEMMAISVVDCALWDLKGKWANAPVYVLLGGPTRTEIPAYASMLGYSIDPELVHERAQEIVRQGYRHTKWFFRDGPTDGVAGIHRNVRLVKTLREAVGPDVDIMLDCWMSWDVPYTIQMSKRLAEYNPRWLEEPVLPDKIAQYAEIRANSHVPISGGEHEYTRWGLKALLDARACDVLATRHLLGGRHLRNDEDHGAGLRLRRTDHSARPFDASHRALYRRLARNHLSLARISGQVERNPPILPQDPAQAHQRQGDAAHHPRPGHGTRPDKIVSKKISF